MKNTAIFDFGGVLIDWDPRHLFRKLIDDEEKLEHFLSAICSDEWQAEQNTGRPWSQAVAVLADEYPEYRSLIEVYQTRWPETLGRAFDGTVEILRDLKRRGVRIIGLTNWSAEMFPHARARYDFINWFEGIVVSGEVGIVKPSPEIFLHLFERFKLPPADAVFIDDKRENVEAAESLGLDSHQFKSPPQLRDFVIAANLI